jgi:hypothetical protein
MNENNKSPTEQSTRPLGNSNPRPTPLARDIGPHIAEKLRADYPGQNNRFFRPFLGKKRTQSGHSRD